MRHGRLANSAAVAAALGLVAAFWWQGERFIAANGPTFDEAAHLAAGYSYYATGDFGMNREDPPLWKLWWALPLVLGDRPNYPHEVAEATNHDHWHVGVALLYSSGATPTRLLTPARRMNLAVGCGVVLVAGWWAFRAWGSRLAGSVACAFAALDPNLLALSCVISTDVGFTFTALLTGYLLWEYAGHPSRRLLFAAGVSLGLMLGSKLSALGMLAGFAAAAGVILLRGGVLALPGVQPAPDLKARARAAADLAFRLMLVALVALAATYGFVHFGEWGRGLKFQLTRGGGHFYLCGELSRTGWLHYFLVALAVKFPLGLIVASAGSVAYWAFSAARLNSERRDLRKPSPLAGEGGERQSREPGEGLESRTPHPRGAAHRLPSPARGEGKNRGWVWLLVPPAVFLAAASASRVDLGVRIVLPAVAFLYVLASSLASRRVYPGGVVEDRRDKPGGSPGMRLRLLALAGCLAWAGVSAWAAAPHQLAHFNETAGGPVGGLRFVADSNLDWGQGLPQLKEYMQREGIDAVYLSYFGTDRPEAYGIRYQQLPGFGRVGPPGGETIPADAPLHVVVSANNLLGIYLDDPGTFAWLRSRRPTAVLGGCLYVFDLTGDVEAIRRVRELPQ